MNLPSRDSYILVVGIGNAAPSDDYVTFRGVRRAEILKDGILYFEDQDGLRHWVADEWAVYEEAQ